MLLVLPAACPIPFVCKSQALVFSDFNLAFAPQTRDAQLSADNPVGPTTCEQGVLGRQKQLFGTAVHFVV